MKNFDLSTYSVEEMTQEEMLITDGGNIFKKIGQALESACEWIGQAASDVWDYMNGHDKGAPEGGAVWSF